MLQDGTGLVLPHALRHHVNNVMHHLHIMELEGNMTNIRVTTKLLYIRVTTLLLYIQVTTLLYIRVTTLLYIRVTTLF